MFRGLTTGGLELARDRRSRWQRDKGRMQPDHERAETRRVSLGRRERISRGVAEVLELPQDIILNVPRVTIIGNLQMTIENHRGIIAYSPEIIRIGIGGGQMTIEGEELAVGSVHSEDLSVMGRFRRLTFVEVEEAPPDGRGRRKAR